MKKQRKKIAVLSLAILMGVSSLTACDNATKQTSSKVDDSVLLCGFENVKEMLTMNLSYMHAKVEMIEDKQYVTEGNAAAKFIIEGELKIDKNGEELYYKDNEIYMFPGNTFMKKTDFSDVIKYSIDIYNANDYSVDIIFGYNHPQATKDTFLFGRRTLKSNQMNHLEFEVDNEVVGNFVDLSGVKNFYFLVEGREKEQETMVLYFDNFSAEIGERKQTTEKKIGVIDFSNKADVHKFVELGSASSIVYRPEFFLNKDLNYISTGRESLKIEFHRDKLDTKIDCVGFRTKDDVLDGFKVDDYENSYLEYEMYNATDSIVTVQMSVYDALNTSYSVTTSIAPHSWSGKEGTSIKLQTLNDFFLGEGLDIMTVGFTVSGLQKEGDSLYLDHLSIVNKQ